MDFEFYDGDIPGWYRREILNNGVVSWDIETGGLDWKDERGVALCQLSSGGKTVIIRPCEKPYGLMSLLTRNDVVKVFHHAMFDLRFMSYHWDVPPKNIRCTKIMAKILLKEKLEKFSLVNLFEFFEMGIEQNKDIARTDWFDKRLSHEQLEYAAKDVMYLEELYKNLFKLTSVEQFGFLDKLFKHIPQRVRLEIEEYGDVYTY